MVDTDSEADRIPAASSVARILRGAGQSVALLLWIAAPLTVVAVLTEQATTAMVVPDELVTVPVQANSSSIVTDVQVSARLGAEPVVVAPAMTGIVESVSMSSGTSVRSGDVVLQVAGVERIAFASSIPFSRPLARGDQGEDVAALNDMLSTLGLPASGGSTVTRATVTGIEQLAKRLGAAATEVFDPGWIVFLPTTAVTIDDVSLVVGAPVPPGGEVIATGRAPIESAVLVTPGSLPQTGAATEPSSPDPGTGDAAAGSQPDGAEGSADSDSTPPAATSALTAPPGAVLRVGTTELALTPDRTGVAPEALPVLAGLLGDEEASVLGQFVTPAPAGQIAVPAAAVFSTPSGHTCVLQVGVSDLTSVAVDVISGTAGMVVIAGPLQVGDEVVVAPPPSSDDCTG